MVGACIRNAKYAVPFLIKLYVYLGPWAVRKGYTLYPKQTSNTFPFTVGQPVPLHSVQHDFKVSYTQYSRSIPNADEKVWHRGTCDEAWPLSLAGADSLWYVHSYSHSCMQLCTYIHIIIGRQRQLHSYIEGNWQCRATSRYSQPLRQSIIE